MEKSSPLVYNLSMINQSIFKLYDIRGIYPQELNEQTAYLVGRAFARKAKAIEVVVGSDMRLSSPQLKEAVIRGITDEGVNVRDIGLIPIDAAYASVGVFGAEAAIMVTASHNPKEYNGFKMVLKNMQWVRGIELQQEVMQLPKLTPGIKGLVREQEIYSQYIPHVLSFMKNKKIKPLRVVVDAGNGMAGKVMPMLAEHLSITMIPLNFELDGNFPAHPSNPLMPESQKQICEAVVKEKADFGIILDGDTDRLFFVDEKGTFIPADITLLLLAKLFLEREPGVGIAYNLLCSKVVAEMVKVWGGVPLRTKVGYVNVSAGMRENNGIMGGELSAHYSFRDNAYADSGFIAFVILLELLSGYEQPLSEIVQPFYKYAKSDANFKVENKEAVIEKIKEKYSDGKQDFLDGVTIEYKDWWFNVRPSNTEPLLRLTIEADNLGLLEEKKKELADFILQIN